jgi:hypothetical protein
MLRNRSFSQSRMRHLVCRQGSIEFVIISLILICQNEKPVKLGHSQVRARGIVLLFYSVVFVIWVWNKSFFCFYFKALLYSTEISVDTLFWLIIMLVKRKGRTTTVCSTLFWEGKTCARIRENKFKFESTDRLVRLCECIFGCTVCTKKAYMFMCAYAKY